MTILIAGLSFIPNSKPSSLLILRADLNTDIKNVKKLVKDSCKYYKEKSENVSKNEVELIIEVECDNSDELMEKLRNINGFTQINLLAHDGEYRI